MASILNLTPHAITIIDEENNVILNIPPSGNVVRLKATTVSAKFTVDDIRITRTEFGEVFGLPEYNSGQFYIVSQLVKNALPNREDLLVPAEVVRDQDGNIIGCKSLGI